MARVLVVEDDAMVRSLFVAVLAAIGHDVRQAAHAFEAVEVMPSFCPDLLLVDFHLPVMDGLALSARTTRLCPTSRIVVMSAELTAEVCARAAALGAVAAVEKPATSSELIELLARVLPESASASAFAF